VAVDIERNNRILEAVVAVLEAVDIGNMAVVPYKDHNGHDRANKAVLVAVDNVQVVAVQNVAADNNYDDALNTMNVAVQSEAVHNDHILDGEALYVLSSEHRMNVLDDAHYIYYAHILALCLRDISSIVPLSRLVSNVPDRDILNVHAPNS